MRMHAGNPSKVQDWDKSLEHSEERWFSQGTEEGRLRTVHKVQIQFIPFGFNGFQEVCKTVQQGVHDGDVFSKGNWMLQERFQHQRLYAVRRKEEAIR